MLHEVMMYGGGGSGGRGSDISGVDSMFVTDPSRLLSKFKNKYVLKGLLSVVNCKRAFRWTVFVITKESKDPNNRVFMGLCCLVEMFILLFATCASVTTEGTRFPFSLRLQFYTWARGDKQAFVFAFLRFVAKYDTKVKMTPPPPPTHKNNVKMKIRNHGKKLSHSCNGEENFKISPIYHL